PEALVALWSASILPISVGHLPWLPNGPCILLGLLMFLGIGSSWIFDKKSSKGAERGYLYKILAILNAVCALLYSFSQMKGLVPESVDVSMTWIIVVICWGVAVASY